MRKFLHPIPELIVALVVLGWAVAVPFQEYTRLRPGAPLTYALDDAYIHMSMAKNLAMQGVYGVTPEGFTSRSSSPLWTLLLALIYRVFGVSDMAPFWLNLILGGLVLWAGWLLAGKLAPARPGVRLTAMVALIFLVPLPAMILSGMETTLQIFLTLLFVSIALAALEREPGTGLGRQDGPLLVVGLLYSAVRYESLALIGLACFLLLLRRRWLLALALGGCALLPVLVYGLISTGNGWWFLPNSVLVKAYEPVKDLDGLWKLLEKRGELMWKEKYLRVVMIGVAAGLALDSIWPTRGGPSLAYRWLAILFLPAAVAQVLLGHLNWFYRYEAYILALGVTLLAGLMGAWLYRFNPRRWVGWVFPVLIAFALYQLTPLWDRGEKALDETPAAMTNIYDQQIQMARFVKTYYAGTCVVSNDIGAISYMGDVCVVDLAGLATRETAQAVLERRRLQPVFEQLAKEKQARLAIAYKTWYPRDIPPDWSQVGTWTVEHNVVLGGPTISFYALTPGEVPQLAKNLEEFSSSLPESVRDIIFR